MSRAVKRTRIALTTLVALGVAASAVPLMPVYLTSGEMPAPPARAGWRSLPALIVDLRDNASPSDVQDIERRLGIDLEFNSPQAEDEKLMRADLGSGQDADRLLAELRKDGRVEIAEREVLYSIPEMPEPFAATALAEPGLLSEGEASSVKSPFTPNDPRYSEQWNFRMIGAEKAWERTRGKGIVVAVIDTGVAATDSTRGKRGRDFGNTTFVKGYDFVHKDDNPYDDHGHGTHVAGTVAESTNNSEGVTGLAFEATIMPLKVLTAEGWGTATDIADAIRFAADKGADVINMSLGSQFPSDIIHSAVKYARKKGVVIVCAAGNGFKEGVSYPAAFPECIAVSSVGPSGNLAFYSSYGKEVALAAPGGDMTKGAGDGILQNTVFPEDQGGRGDDYYHFQGTSMASPHVAAAAALVMAQGVKDAAKVRDVLTQTAAPKNDKKKYGAGILSVEKATAKAADQQESRSHKGWAFALLAALTFLVPFRQPVGLRLGLIGALGVGMLGMDQATAFFGVNSAWNLVFFSAVLPFILYFEWETRYGRKLLAAFALGVAVGLSWNLLNGMVPFSVTEFGLRAVPWTLANAGAALLIALASWRRAK